MSVCVKHFGSNTETELDKEPIMWNMQLRKR